MSIQPYILAIDSSTSVLRVGISLPPEKIISAENRDRYRHAEFIFKLIDNVLIRNDIDKFQLKAIIVSTGPGSFTGLRVGLASAKGLAISLNKPLVGVSTFSSIAGGLYQKFGKTGVLIPSRRDEYYFGIIDSNRFDDNKIAVLSTAEINNLPEKINLLGIDFDPENLNLSGFRIIRPDQFSPGIRDFISAGQQRLMTSGGDDISRLEPLYVQKFPMGVKK